MRPPGDHHHASINPLTCFLARWIQAELESLVTLKRVLAFSSTWSFRRGFGRASCMLISGTKMALKLASNCRNDRRADHRDTASEAARVEGILQRRDRSPGRVCRCACRLGTLRRIPVLHNLTGLVDPELLNTFDLEALRQEKTHSVTVWPRRTDVAVADPYGDFRVLYEKRFPGVELSLALNLPGPISALLAQNQRIQQITQDEIRQPIQTMAAPR